MRDNITQSKVYKSFLPRYITHVLERNEATFYCGISSGPEKNSLQRVYSGEKNPVCFSIVNRGNLLIASDSRHRVQLFCHFLAIEARYLVGFFFSIERRIFNFNFLKCDFFCDRAKPQLQFLPTQSGIWSRFSII